VAGGVNENRRPDACHRGMHGRPSPFPSLRETAMNLSFSIGPLVSLLAGILILIVPRMLNFIVAIYLILIGLIGLFGHGSLKL
jgi:hypothetical protein